MPRIQRKISSGRFILIVDPLEALAIESTREREEDLLGARRNNRGRGEIGEREREGGGYTTVLIAIKQRQHQQLQQRADQRAGSNRHTGKQREQQQRQLGCGSRIGSDIDRTFAFHRPLSRTVPALEI